MGRISKAGNESPAFREKYEFAHFWSQVDAPDDEGACWLWRAAINPSGYGALARNGRTLRAHREAYRLVSGSIPPGVMVLHKCDVRACVNPDHLFLGTADDNTQDMISKGRMCEQPKLFTPEQVQAIRDDPRSTRELAKAYGCARQTIWQYKTGKRGGPLPLPSGGDRA